MLADDLLEQAYHLALREKNKPRQASLRRAVSTGYYALFHLLVAEIVGNWGGKNRSSLARGCEHRRMKEASKAARKKNLCNCAIVWPPTRTKWICWPKAGWRGKNRRSSAFIRVPYCALLFLLRFS